MKIAELERMPVSILYICVIDARDELYQLVALVFSHRPLDMKVRGYANPLYPIC